MGHGRRWIPLIAWGAWLFLALTPGCASTPPEVRPEPFQPKYRTTAHQMLVLEKPFGAELADVKRLETVIGRAETVIEQKYSYDPTEASSILETIYIVVKENYAYRPRRLLHQGLKSNQLDCDLFVAVYLSIAEVMRLPINAVVAPLHTFVRWRLSNGKHLNWETTTGRERLDDYYLSGAYLGNNDHFYRPNFNLAPGIKTGAYMRGLSNREFMAIPHINVAARYLEKYQKMPDKGPRPCQSLEKALRHLRIAVSLDAKRPEAYHGQGVVLHLMGRNVEALASLDEAVSLYPEDPMYYFDRGRVYLAVGNVEQAVIDLTQAYHLNPLHKQAAFELASLWRRLGNKQESESWWKKAVSPPPAP